MKFPHGRHVIRMAWAGLGLTTVLLLTASAAVRADLMPNGNVLTLAPSDAAGIGSVDCGWLWANTAEIREQPRVADLLNAMQAKLGISFQSDIAPWLGKAAVADIAPPEATPEPVAFLEIRDHSAFENMLFKLSTNPEVNSQIKITSVPIDGRSVLQVSGPGVPGGGVYVTVERNWLVAAIGSAAMDDLAKVWSGEKTNLSTNAAFNGVLQKIGASRAAFWAIGDPKVIAAKFVPASAKIVFGNVEDLAGLSLVDHGNSFDINSAVYATSPAAEALFRRVANGVPPITGASLQTIPNSAFIVSIISSPGHLINFMNQELYENAGAIPGGEALFITSMLNQYRDIYEPLTGELAIAGSYSANYGGATVSAGTSSKTASTDVAMSIARLISHMNPGFKRAGNEWSVAPTGGYPSMFDPAMRVTGRYVELSTSPKLLDAPEGHPGLVLPADAVGSIDVMLFSFKYAKLLFNFVLPTMTDSGPKKLAGILMRHSIQNASMAAWQKVDPAGQFETGTVRLSGLDWKSTLQDISVMALSNIPSTTTPAPVVPIPATPPAVTPQPVPATPSSGPNPPPSLPAAPQTPV